MKKRLTGILAFIVSMTMAASMLTACDGAKKNDGNGEANTKTEQKNEKAPEEMVEATLEDFMGALVSYALKGAAKYALDTGFLDELDGGLGKVIESSLGEMKDYFPEGMVARMLDTAMGDYFGGITYDKVKVEMNDDKTKATVKFSLHIPDINGDSFQDDKIQKYFSDSLGFDLNDSDALIKEYASRKGKSVEELTAEFTGGDMSTLLKDVFSTFENEFVDAMDNAMIDAVNSAKTNETECTAVIEKQSDGSWKITSMD